MLSITLRLLSIFLMISMGWIARKRKIINEDVTRSLSRLLTVFFYPALIFSSMTRNFNIQNLSASWQLPLGAFLIMLAGFCVGLLIEKHVVDPHSRKGHAFLFQCTINNYSFLPMPLALMFWGEAGVAGLIFASLGPEVAVWTLGVYALSGRQLKRENIKNILTPPLITIGVTLMTILLRDLLPEPFPSLLTHPAARGVTESLGSAMVLFGSASIPVAMVIAGSRMAELRFQHLFAKLQMIVSALRLMLVPALVVIVTALIPLDPEVRRILTLISTMPSAVAGVVLSEIYRADSEFAASSVLTTHVFCLFTVPVWLYFLV